MTQKGHPQDQPTISPFPKEEDLFLPAGNVRHASPRVCVDLVPAGRPPADEFAVKLPLVSVMIGFGECTVWEGLDNRPLVKRHFRNRFHFMPAETKLNVRVSNPAPEFVIIHVDAAFAASVTAELFERSDLGPPKIGNSEAKLLALGKTIRGQMLAKGELKALQLESFATLCLAEWSKDADEGPHISISLKALAKVKDYIQEHLERDLTLADLAAIAELSPSYFLKSFKETVGQTPHRYLTECRLRRARDRLERTDLALAEIAYVSGFASQSHMTDVFRTHLNISPGRYRKMMVS